MKHGQTLKGMNGNMFQFNNNDMKKELMIPTNLDFHKHVEEVHETLKTIQEENLLDLSHPDKPPVVVLCEILQHHRLTCAELLKLIRIK